MLNAFVAFALLIVAAISTFDAQVAEAQRLLRELDHSMAMYDSTHGSHSAIDDSHDCNDDQIAIGSSEGDNVDQGTSSSDRDSATEVGGGTVTNFLSNVGPLRVVHKREEQQQSASTATGRLSKAQATSNGSASVHADPSLVMADEDLDDLM